MAVKSVKIKFLIKHPEYGKFYRLVGLQKRILWHDIHGSADGTLTRYTNDHNYEFITPNKIKTIMTGLFGNDVIPVIMPCYSRIMNEKNIDGIEILGNWDSPTWCDTIPLLDGTLNYAPHRVQLMGAIKGSFRLVVRNYNKRDEGDFATVHLSLSEATKMDNTIIDANGTGGYELILYDQYDNVVSRKYSSKKYALDILENFSNGYINLTPYGAKLMKTMQ